MKVKPSAAATTLSMASMLSVVSGAFTSQTQDASSIVSDTDSEEENSTQSGAKNENRNANSSENVWLEHNLNQSAVRSPKKTKRTSQTILHTLHWRGSTER